MERALHWESRQRPSPVEQTSRRNKRRTGERTLSRRKGYHETRGKGIVRPTYHGEAVIHGSYSQDQRRDAFCHSVTFVLEEREGSDVNVSL
jgi:ribosomal protein L4